MTSTSSGVPSQEATRWLRSTVGQKRTPAFGAQAWPNGASGAWACAGAALGQGGEGEREGETLHARAAYAAPSAAG